MAFKTCPPLSGADRLDENEVICIHAAIVSRLVNYDYFHRSTAFWEAAAKKITG